MHQRSAEPGGDPGDPLDPADPEEADLESDEALLFINT